MPRIVWKTFLKVWINVRNWTGYRISSFKFDLMLTKIISGHQTGADIAAIDAARDQGFPCGGWVSRGRETEEGPLHEKYIVNEMITGDYSARTRQNIVYSDGTVIFTHGKITGGSELTRRFAVELQKPWLHIDLSISGFPESVKMLSDFIADNNIKTLHVAGKAASNDTRVYEPVYRIIEGYLRYTS